MTTPNKKRKKPSERIEEIFFDLVQKEGMNVDRQRLWYVAILNYLDEQSEATDET